MLCRANTGNAPVAPAPELWERRCVHGFDYEYLSQPGRKQASGLFTGSSWISEATLNRWLSSWKTEQRSGF